MYVGAVGVGTGQVLVSNGVVIGAYPPAYAVLYGVPYGPNGTDYTGTLMVPTAADIAAATLAALQASAIPVNVQRVNGVLLQGTGTPGDSMRPA